MDGLNNMVELLYKGGYSCVISNGGEIRTFSKRGVIDLYEILESDRPFLNASSIADKVVGKAAAALMILGGGSPYLCRHNQRICHSLVKELNG